MRLKGAMTGGGRGAAAGESGQKPATAASAQGGAPPNGMAQGVLLSGVSGGSGACSRCTVRFPTHIESASVFHSGGLGSPQRRRCNHPGNRRDARDRPHRNYFVERGGTDSSGSTECWSGDDADTLELGRRAQRRCHAIGVSWRKRILFPDSYRSIETDELMMKFQKCLRYTFIIFLLMFAASSFAQQANGSLRGQVTDPSGAAISGASVIMTPATGSPIVVQSDPQGMYEFKTLAAGKYTLTVAATGIHHSTKTTTS